MNIERHVKKIFWCFPYKLRRMLYPFMKHEAYNKYKYMFSSINQNGYSFKGYYEKKMIFVHIPKCAGRSISKSLCGQFAGPLPAKNFQLFMSKDDFESFFKFTIVRNPWDRVYSAYNFLKSGGINRWDKKFARENITSFNNFEDFVLNWITKTNVNRALHFRPQHEFVCDHRGEILVDFIGRFENLEVDYKKICDILDVKAPLMYLNKSYKKGNYKDYYSNEMKEKIAKIYYKDVKLFNYYF